MQNPFDNLLTRFGKVHVRNSEVVVTWQSSPPSSVSVSEKLMNLKQENFFQYFQEDEDDNTTFPDLSVPTTTPFDDFTLHASHIPPPPSVHLSLISM